MISNISPEEAKELRLLWIQYDSAIARVLKIRQTEGAGNCVLPKILVAYREANEAIRRIKEIHGKT